VHKIKDPKQYGGWSKLMQLWGLLPLVGLIIGIIGMNKDNEVKKAQSLIFVSLFLGVLGALNLMV
jgi:hypothetical protein